MYSDVFDAISIIGDWPEKKILSLVTAVQLSLLFRLSATSDGTIVIIIIIIMLLLLLLITTTINLRSGHDKVIKRDNPVMHCVLKMSLTWTCINQLWQNFGRYVTDEVGKGNQCIIYFPT